MKDFQLAASSKKKDELDAMRSDACKAADTTAESSIASVPPENTIPKLIKPIEAFSDEVLISKAEYKKLKSAFEAFDKVVGEL
jgi:hypothetical protein